MHLAIKNIVSGVFVGVAILPITVPMEMLKLRAQVKNDGAMNYKQELKVVY